MKTPNNATPQREGSEVKRQSGMQARVVVPDRQSRPERTHDIVTAIADIAALLDSGGSPDESFRRLVTIVRRVIPTQAIVIAPLRREDRPLVWTNEASALEPLEVVSGCRAALAPFVPREAWEAWEHTDEDVEVTTPRECLSVPILASGAVVGMLRVIAASPFDEAGLTLVACLASQLAPLLRTQASLERLRPVQDSDVAAALRRRDEVLAMVSHDLKNAIAVVMMSVSHVLEGMPPGERRERGRPQLERIRRTAQNMMQLVSDLVDVEGMDAGRIGMSPQPFSLRALVMEQFDDLAPQASRAGITLVCEVPEGLPLAQADSDRVKQVLSNLVGNALKFTPCGGRVSARAALLEDKGSREIAVMIADTGIGIGRDQLERIFERRWRGGHEVTVGSGLGLTICRALVEQAGGRIWAESTLGTGTTMTFTLPAAPRVEARNEGAASVA